MSKKEKQIKEITDNDLDIGKDLVTENYELEILTLKDKVDLRRFSRSFLKVDKLLKSIFTGKEDKFPKNNGFNRVKTDLVENDTNKVFSAKGAFDLKTWLVTNYTTLMNNIRDTLTNSINTKLPHGGYNQSAQTLKNEIDDRYTKSQSDSRYPRYLGVINISTNLDALTQSGYFNGQVTSEMLGGHSVYTWGLFVVERGAEACIQTYYSHQGGHIIRRAGYGSGSISWHPWYRVYTSLQKPTKADVGLSEADNTPDSNKNVRSAARLTTARTITIGNKSYIFDGTTDISYSLSDIGALNKAGDTMTGNLEIRKQDWAGIQLNCTGSDNPYNQRIENNKGKLMFISNRKSDGQSAYVGLEPGVGGTLYHTGFKPTPSDIGTYSSGEINNTFSKGRGRLPAFNGTWGDFDKNISNGVYYIDANNFNQLGLPSGTYSYGTLIVNKSAGNPVNVMYISDGLQNMYMLNIFNFANNPSNTFSPSVWYGVYTTRSKPTATDVGLGNVSNVAQVTDIRMSGNTRITTWDKAIDTYASGRVQTGSWKDNQGANLDGVYYAALQKCVNGTWYTVATS